MMRYLTHVLVLAVVVCAGCELWHDYTPTILWRGTDENIQAAAREAAHADIAAGSLRVAISGTDDPAPYGIPQASWPLVRSYPTLDLPSGCTARLAREGRLYGEAYNEVVAPYVLKRVAELGAEGR